MVQDENGDAWNDWTLDMSAGFHLINIEQLLLQVKEWRDEVALSENEKLVLTKVGNVRLFLTANDKASTALLSNVYFAPILARTIVSCS
uniref:Retrovirus-related Pol polyprotein from transposon TNT 1-94-like beta-barrel domain-containing protein n=1 Tax=Peronospora matthiolae TaxID=2874970 RepID=A0AAV1TQ68_9STRA